MDAFAWSNLLLFLALLLAIAWPLGAYIARIADADARPLGPVGDVIERALYRVCGIDRTQSMGWKSYAVAALVFNVLGVVAVYLLQRLQALLPLNPEHMPADRGRR